MAIFNEILTGRFNKALQKICAIKGGAAVKQLGSEVLPVFPLFWGAEARYLESWQLYGLTVDVAANAANTSAFQLANPGNANAGSANLVPKSNVIAVIVGINFVNYSGAAITIYTEFGRIGATIGNLAGQPDLRSGCVGFDNRGNTAPMCIPSSTNISGAVGSISNTPLIAVLGTNQMFEMIPHEGRELPLLPGDYIRMHNTILNSPCTLSIMWRERYLEDQERF